MSSQNITWCVVYTQPLKELVAKQHLLDQGYQVYFPQFKKIRRHARKSEEVLKPLFPRYIFVGIDLNSARWRSINGTRGAVHILMRDAVHPACLPSYVIEDLKSCEMKEGIVPVSSLIAFVKGEKVRILEGAFKDYVATFETLDDKSRIQLLVHFMGRDIKMTLPGYGVEAA